MNKVVYIAFVAGLIFTSFRSFAQEQENQKQEVTLDDEIKKIKNDYQALEKKIEVLMKQCRVIYGADSDMALRMEFAYKHSKEKMIESQLTPVTECYPSLLPNLQTARSALEELQTLVRVLKRIAPDSVPDKLKIIRKKYDKVRKQLSNLEAEYRMIYGADFFISRRIQNYIASQDLKMVAAMMAGDQGKDPVVAVERAQSALRGLKGLCACLMLLVVPIEPWMCPNPLTLWK
jgi:predicted  nucleic acid-binding Zn-ribbon protein